MWVNLVILSLVTLQRLSELYVSRRNTRRLIARGGYEVGSGHYWLIIAFHTVWIVALWVYAWDNPVNWTWLFVYLAIQAMRGWVVAALGGAASAEVLSADRFGAERPAVGVGADHLVVQVDRAAAHAGHGLRGFEPGGGRCLDQDEILIGAEVREDADDFDVELLGLRADGRFQ